MDYTNLLGGIACLTFGAWLTIRQIRKVIKGTQDNMGWDIRAIGGGISFVIIGIYLLSHLYGK